MCYVCPNMLLYNENLNSCIKMGLNYSFFFREARKQSYIARGIIVSNLFMQPHTAKILFKILTIILVLRHKIHVFTNSFEYLILQCTLNASIVFNFVMSIYSSHIV